ncbi:hypothetical protein Scep_030103 [Stephania cephalantha]|uniref:Uncharacterized protein n=1 Tax=Stephania cephalantha TaxID=152367 RepID=A0AAP0E2I7_9MAGN
MAFLFDLDGDLSSDHADYNHHSSENEEEGEPMDDVEECFLRQLEEDEYHFVEEAFFDIVHWLTIHALPFIQRIFQKKFPHMNT